MLMRRATLTDAESAHDLSQLAYAQWVPVIGREPLPMTVDYDEAIRTHIVDLLEDAGTLCGLIELVPQDTHLLIESIAVHPDHQGKGHGTLLLEHAEATATQLGFIELRLYTNAAFISNLKFYADHGYVELERSILIPGSITVHMNKKLGMTA